MSRKAPLAMAKEEFREAGHRLVDRLADLMAAVPDGPVTKGEGPAAIREALALEGPLPEKGSDATALLLETAERLFGHSCFNAHPRFFGYITAPPAPIGVLGDLIASAANPNLGLFQLAPAATEIEVQAIRWIAELIGFPSDCGGIMVSGGNVANLVAFFAGRTSAAGWDIRARGLAGGDRPLRVYASAETHTWIQKAADLSGLGTDSIRWIETDDRLRMRVDALRRAIDEDRRRGDVPLLVVGTAGSVSTGTVDPLPELAAVCRERGIWFHVDGAYGGLAAALPDVDPALRGLALADSVAVDPHKWLYAPLEAGCTLVRDPAKLRAAFLFHPPYYEMGVERMNFVDYGIQNSRGFRALKVWLGLRHAGAAGYRTMIAEDIALSRRLAGAVSRTPELELLTQELSITTFRYVPERLRNGAGTEDGERALNELNKELLQTLQQNGEAFLSNAVIRGKYALRACVVNFHTSAADVDAVPEIVMREARAVEERLHVRSK
ncbi:MAG TPA: aspartate aminotransferase family protein [Candidatus Eisenbacteria bacterium]|nr:aspartate aminotransferase family protein [Candidatus Eisenbacteria bacterium]